MEISILTIIPLNYLSDGNFIYLELLVLMLVIINSRCVYFENVKLGIYVCLADPLRTTSFVPPTLLAFCRLWCLCDEYSLFMATLFFFFPSPNKKVMGLFRCSRWSSQDEPVESVYCLPVNWSASEYLMNFLNELKTSILIRFNIPLVTQMGPTNERANMLCPIYVLMPWCWLS